MFSGRKETRGRQLMPKDVRDADPSEVPPIRPDGDPPPLSENLIEELYAAVNKARQKRASEPPSSR
jgi:hypothetical protein